MDVSVCTTRIDRICLFVWVCSVVHVSVAQSFFQPQPLALNAVAYVLGGKDALLKTTFQCGRDWSPGCVWFNVGTNRTRRFQTPRNATESRRNWDLALHVPPHSRFAGSVHLSVVCVRQKMYVSTEKHF